MASLENKLVVIARSKVSGKFTLLKYLEDDEYDNVLLAFICPKGDRPEKIKASIVRCESKLDKNIEYLTIESSPVVVEFEREDYGSNSYSCCELGPIKFKLSESIDSSKIDTSFYKGYKGKPLYSVRIFSPTENYIHDFEELCSVEKMFISEVEE